MTNCTVCGLPCVGSEDTSNPLCAGCLALNFAGADYDRLTWLREPETRPQGRLPRPLEEWVR